jgi:signal peptidase I
VAESTAGAQRDEGGVWELIKVVVQALLIALVFRTFLFHPFNIPSGSMEPTLLVGDYLFVSKYSYGYSRYSFPFVDFSFIKGRIWEGVPKRGDVVVFRPPREPETDYIKRVIGLPGDRIQVRNGVLFINDQEVKREAAGTWEGKGRYGNEMPIREFRETLPNGVSYETLDLVENGFYDNTPIYEVPADHYFMMGDNRDNSTDSRVLSEVGYVPFDNFVGRAEIIFFSVEEGRHAWAIWEWPWTVRWSRIFNLL